jgi:hypothetical protein
MRKRWPHYNGPRVLNELRNSQDGYGRRRRINDLKYVLYWDDYFRETKNWKDHRKKQYRDRPRGEQHEMLFDEKFWRKRWKLECYLKDHNIPYRIEELRETHTYERTIRTRRVKDRQVPVFTTVWRWAERPDGTKFIVRERGHQTGFRWEYRDEPLDKPYTKKYKGSTTTGYRLTWWSDKDIGIEYILRRIER